MKTAFRQEVNQGCSILKESLHNLSKSVRAPQVHFISRSQTLKPRITPPLHYDKELSEGMSI